MHSRRNHDNVRPNTLKMLNADGKTLLNYIRWRLHRNMNFLPLVVGGTGSGKSYAALRLCYLLDPNFSEEQICFKPEDVLELIKRPDMKHRPIIFDEAGVGIDSRKWQSNVNKLLMNVFETFRSRGNVLIPTTPKVSFIDKKARNLLHAVIRTVKIDYHAKLNYCKVQLVKPNELTDQEPLYPFMKTAVGGQKKKVKRCCFRLPPRHLIDIYEHKKDDFLTNLYDDITDKLRHADLKPLAPQQLKVWDLYKNGVRTVTDMANTLKKKPSTITHLSNAIRAKGYPLVYERHTQIAEKGT